MNRNMVDVQKSGTAYVVEWGAISLPLGHPSRITCMDVYLTLADAEAAAEAADFDCRVFPIVVPDPALPENGREGDPQ